MASRDVKLCRYASGRHRRETQGAHSVQTDHGDDVGMVAVSAQFPHLRETLTSCETSEQLEV